LAGIDPKRLPKTQLVHYRSPDGTVISAFLWMPYNLSRNGHAPAVVLAHGGPTGQKTDDFDPTAVALASRGYVVIAPNPRGSTGYGRTFQAANHRDLGGGDLADYAAGARFVESTGYVDARRIGIAGLSYGGYMTLMALSKTPEVWAAGVEICGITNWLSVYERGSPMLREYLVGLLGDPVKDKAVYAASSPLMYLTHVKAPLLVLAGGNDIRVPPSEAAQVVQFLSGAGKTVDTKVYAGEGHGFFKRENQIDALERTVAWFDRYMNDGVATSGASH
jgi:dipeptidyl aminopeptidase/acylaminoacyl peptidase